jgi:hypothetical protein
MLAATPLVINASLLIVTLLTALHYATQSGNHGSSAEADTIAAARQVKADIEAERYRNFKSDGALNLLPGATDHNSPM